MAQIVVCDVCQGAVKEKPIFVRVASDNLMFKNVEQRKTSGFEMIFPHLFARDTFVLDRVLDLCETCGPFFIKVLDRAIEIGKFNAEEFRKMTEAGKL